MMLSICTTVKNRSRVSHGAHELALFPNCVDSIASSAASGIRCELVVADWQSDDWPVGDWLESRAKPVPTTIVTLEGSFSRGRGLNAAAAAAAGDCLVFIDADLLIGERLLRIGRDVLAEGKALFPVLYSFDTPEHSSGWWRHEGFGNCIVTRDVYTKSGGWPEYNTWGREDEDFHTRIASLTEVVRHEVPDLYHQWHPNELLWKNRYSERYSEMLDETRQRNRAIGALCSVVPPEARVVLIDEGRFGDNPLPDRPTFPLLENNGEYFGPPPDDATAISELHRLRSRGASYVAFAWMAFWWLEYYCDFARHLRLQFPIIYESPELVVFDMTFCPRPTALLRDLRF